MHMADRQDKTFERWLDGVEQGDPAALEAACRERSEQHPERGQRNEALADLESKSCTSEMFCQ